MPKVKQFNKEKVLEAASHIFRQKGYNGTSIDDILKATNLSRSSLYDSFKDKHSLYLAALEFYKDREKNGYNSLDEKTLNGLEKIDLLFKEVINHLIEHPNDNGCLMVNAAAEMSKQCDKTSHIVCNNKDDIENLFATWLKDAEDSKLLKLSKPTKSYGTFLFNTLCGLKVLSQSGATRNDLSNVVKLSMDALN
ncbi:MAG: TetR/AcrR family transcriptional regulator [Bacteroidia bacterium]|nr:TetR/AcrR family transcriptional regulator [Bacteroidia bacterium]